VNGTDSETSSTLPTDLAAAPLEIAAPVRFSWPPASSENPLLAAAETWRWSVFQPASFFRAMPQAGYRSALLFYLPVGILAGGLNLFWSNVMGLSSWFESLGEGPSTSPASRLVDFLLSPLWLTALLFIAAALIHSSLKLLGGASRPFVTTTRVFAFSGGPSLFSIVPLIGPLAGGIWSMVLVVIGLREAHATTTLRALAALLLPIAIVFMLIVVAGALFAIGILAAGVQMID
jgi:hypothetical protein